MAKKRPGNSGQTRGKNPPQEAHPDQDVSLWRSLQKELVEMYFTAIRKALGATLEEKDYPSQPEDLKRRLHSLDSMGQAPTDALMMSELFDDMRVVEYELERGGWEAAVARMYNVGWRAGNLGVADFVRIGKKVRKGGRQGGRNSVGYDTEARHAALQRDLDKLHEKRPDLSWTGLSQQVAKKYGMSARHVRSVCSNPRKKMGDSP